MKIKEIRTQLGLTQAELAKLLGYSSQTRIAEFENETRTPSKQTQIILLLIKLKIISVKTLEKIKIL